MNFNKIPVFMGIMLSLLISVQCLDLYSEKYRPQLHYSPPKSWMNDPNGLVYYKDTYHLFYQNYPFDTKWGPMHWGHAISKDLIHWQTLPIALYPDGKEFIFSGSCVIDFENSTGYQNIDNEIQTMIAVFTAYNEQTKLQKQWMAYSIDEGLNWKFYANNPIIANPNFVDFRDPKIIRYNDIYVIIIAVGNHIQIYNSRDLKHWQLSSQFGENDGSHDGIWECPDLFPLDVVIKGTIVEKWILTVGTSQRTQYFIGTFDGHTFKNDNPKETTLWVANGPDSYAGVTYNNAPDNRRIMISWMNRWEYADKLTFNSWNGQTTIPKDLKLVYSESENRLLLSCEPIQEIKKLRINSFQKKDIVIKSNTRFRINDWTNFESKLLDIKLMVDLNGFQQKSGFKFGLEFKGVDNKLSVFFNGWLGIDRTNAGKHDFHPNFARVYESIRQTNSSFMDIRIILDVSSVELFADNGRTVMTSLFFTDNNLTTDVNIFFESMETNSEIRITELNVHQLKSIWNINN